MLSQHLSARYRRDQGQLIRSGALGTRGWEYGCTTLPEDMFVVVHVAVETSKIWTAPATGSSKDDCAAKSTYLSATLTATRAAAGMATGAQGVTVSPFPSPIRPNVTAKESVFGIEACHFSTMMKIFNYVNADCHTDPSKIVEGSIMTSLDPVTPPRGRLPTLGADHLTGAPVS